MGDEGFARGGTGHVNRAVMLEAFFDTEAFSYELHRWFLLVASPDHYVGTIHDSLVLKNESSRVTTLIFSSRVDQI